MALDLDAGQWLILVFIFGLIVLGFVHHGEQTRLAHQRQRTPVRRATTPLRIDPRFAVKGNYFHTLGDDISSESGPAGRLGIVEVDPPTPTPAPAPKRPIAEQLDIKPSPDTAAQAGASKPHSSLAAQPQGSQTSLPANSVTQLISLPVKTKPFTRSAARAVSNNDTASGSGSNNATASGAAFAPAPSSHAPTEEKKPEWSPVILIDLKEVAGKKNEETGRRSIRLKPLPIGHFDHISESMGVLARLNANELVEQAKNYNPPRTTTPFKSRNALPSDATRGVAEEIMSYDNGLARAEDEWVEKGYANQIGLFAQYENVRLAGLRSAGEGFQWLPAPGPPTPTLPAVDLATHKIVSHIHIEDWRVDTGTVADNEKLDKERARVETEYDVDEKSKIPVAARFMRRSPPPADAWDGVVRNNNKTGHGILVKDDNGEIINPERVNARKRKRQLDPEEASRHVKFRLESTAMSHPRPRGSAFDGRSDPNQQPRPEAVLATLPFLQLNNEELVTLARYVPPGKLPRKAVRSNKYYWNKYMQRIKAYIAAIKAMSELSHELKLKPIEAFITGEYLPLSQEVPDYVLEDEDPFEVACEPDDYEYEYEYSEDEDEAEVDGVPYGDPKKRSTMNKESVFDGASTLSLLADETDDFYWSGLEKRMRRCFRSSFAVFEHLKLLEIFNITDPRRKESQAALHRAMLFSYACDYSRLDDANLDTLIKNGFNHTNPFVDIGVTEFDEEDGVPSSTFEAIKRYVDIRRANRAANKATSFEEIAALAGIFPRGGIVGDAAVNVETMHPLLYRRIGACCDMIHYAFMRRGSALERLGKNAPLEDEVEWHATFAAVALALTFGPDDLADVGATVLDPDSDASTTTAAGATVAPVVSTAAAAGHSTASVPVAITSTSTSAATSTSDAASTSDNAALTPAAAASTSTSTAAAAAALFTDTCQTAPSCSPLTSKESQLLANVYEVLPTVKASTFLRTDNGDLKPHEFSASAKSREPEVMPAHEESQMPLSPSLSSASLPSSRAMSVPPTPARLRRSLSPLRELWREEIVPSPTLKRMRSPSPEEEIECPPPKRPRFASPPPRPPVASSSALTLDLFPLLPSPLLPALPITTTTTTTSLVDAWLAAAAEASAAEASAAADSDAEEEEEDEEGEERIPLPMPRTRMGTPGPEEHMIFRPRSLLPPPAPKAKAAPKVKTAPPPKTAPVPSRAMTRSATARGKQPAPAPEPSAEDARNPAADRRSKRLAARSTTRTSPIVSPKAAPAPKPRRSRKAATTAPTPAPLAPAGRRKAATSAPAPAPAPASAALTRKRKNRE